MAIGWPWIDIEWWHSNGSGDRSTGIIWTASKSTVIEYFRLNLSSEEKFYLITDFSATIVEIVLCPFCLSLHSYQYFKWWLIIDFEMAPFFVSILVQIHGLYLDQKTLSTPMSLAVINAVISSYQQVRNS